MPKLKHCVIVLAGPVGVGKSTQARLLASRLRSQGFKVKVSYLRFDHLLAYVMELLLIKLTSGRKLLGRSAPLAVLHNYNPLLFKKIYKLWKLLLIVSIAVKYLISIFIPCKIGFIVIVEDWLITTICDYLHIHRAYNIPYRQPDHVVRYLIRLIRMQLNTYVVILDADLRRLVKNWKTRGSLERDKGYLTDPYNYIDFLRRMIPSLARILSINSVLIVNIDDQTPDYTADLISKWILSS